jgi:hypothetical protein
LKVRLQRFVYLELQWKVLVFSSMDS